MDTCHNRVRWSRVEIGLTDLGFKAGVVGVAVVAGVRSEE